MTFLERHNLKIRIVHAETHEDDWITLNCTFSGKGRGRATFKVRTKQKVSFDTIVRTLPLYEPRELDQLPAWKKVKRFFTNEELEELRGERDATLRTDNA